MSDWLLPLVSFVCGIAGCILGILSLWKTRGQ